MLRARLIVLPVVLSVDQSSLPSKDFFPFPPNRHICIASSSSEQKLQNARCFTTNCLLSIWLECLLTRDLTKSKTSIVSQEYQKS